MQHQLTHGLRQNEKLSNEPQTPTASVMAFAGVSGAFAKLFNLAAACGKRFKRMSNKDTASLSFVQVIKEKAGGELCLQFDPHRVQLLS